MEQDTRYVKVFYFFGTNRSLFQCSLSVLVHSEACDLLNPSKSALIPAIISSFELMSCQPFFLYWGTGSRPINPNLESSEVSSSWNPNSMNELVRFKWDRISYGPIMDVFVATRLSSGLLTMGNMYLYQIFLYEIVDKYYSIPIPKISRHKLPRLSRGLTIYVQMLVQNIIFFWSTITHHQFMLWTFRNFGTVHQQF